MTKANKILVAVLVAQVALVALVYTRSGASSVEPPRLLFAGFDAEDVAKIAISEAPDDDAKAKNAGPDVVLSRKGEGWVLTSHADYAVTTDKVDTLLTALAQAKVRAPIATSESRRGQLGVDAAKFRKKVTVTTTGGKATTFFIGERAAGGNVAIRLDNDDAIYAVASSVASAAGTSARTWVDPTIAEVATETIATMAVTTPAGSYTFALMPGGKKWSLEGAPEGDKAKALDQAFINRMAKKLTKLTLNDIVGAKDAPEYGLAAPLATVTVTLRPQPPEGTAEDPASAAVSVAPEVVTLTIGALADDRHYYVKTGTGPYIFTVLKSTLEPFTQTGPDTVFEAAKSDAKNGQSAKPGKGTKAPAHPAPAAPSPTPAH